MMKKADSGAGVKPMQDTKDEYLEAWSEDDGEQKTDPVVAAVKAARKADDEEFRDAYENDKFGLVPSTAEDEVKAE